MRSGDITVTDGRLNKLLNDKIVGATQDSTLNSIDERVNETRLQGGILKKFYAYQDRAEVKLDNGKIVSCELLHRFGPDLIDLYTPLGETFFDDSINERYIVPRGEMYCVVSSFVWKDKEKYVLMGYWLNDDLVGANPASPGNFKVLTRGGSIQYKLGFGLDGFEVVTNEVSTTFKDDFHEDRVADYVDRDEVYTKDEVYSKDDVYTKSEVEDIVEAWDNRAIILALGLGLFNIRNGHLIVELPLQVSNFFEIDDGHLKVTVDGDNQFRINDDGHLIYGGIVE